MNVCHVIGYYSLYQHYRGQTSPQPCHVRLNCDDAIITAEYNGIIGSGVPIHVFNMRHLCWPIPCLTADAANALLDELAPLADKVVDGYDLVYDGHNHIGKFDGEAMVAREAIHLLTTGRDFNDAQLIEAWDAADYYRVVGNVDTQRKLLGITTDCDIDAVIRRERRDAQPRLINNLDSYLRELQERCT